MQPKGFSSSCQTSTFRDGTLDGRADTNFPSRFGGDPAPNSTSDPATDSGNAPSLLDKVKLGVAETAKSFMLDMWLARQTQEKVLPIIQKVIEGAKEEFADAVANGDGIYAVGYCFGGKYVLLLGAELPDTVAKGQALKDEEQGITKSGAQIRAGAVAHGGFESGDIRTGAHMIQEL